MTTRFVVPDDRDKKDAIQAKFMRRVDTCGSCWIWNGSRNKRTGYGHFCHGQMNDLAHRVMYMLWFGEIPDGLVVRHSCDNPSCVKPDHLKIGTQAENVSDMVERGRSTRGEKNPMARMTEDMVREARILCKVFGVSHEKLARRFGVARRTVSSAVNGTNWGHI